jgi:hypothetical protein
LVLISTDLRVRPHHLKPAKKSAGIEMNANG